MSKSYYRVSFLSNSQRCRGGRAVRCNVKELLSCFLFKQFTTAFLAVCILLLMSKSYYRVSFLSNSQLSFPDGSGPVNVKELLSCFLFKQFTTNGGRCKRLTKMSKSYYRVSFLSNSQRTLGILLSVYECQRATIVFPF